MYKGRMWQQFGILCLLTFVTFLLPPASGEKILVASLSLLANICFLDYATQTISHAPTHTPILIKLVCLQLVLLVLAVLLNAVVLNISRGPHTPWPFPLHSNYLSFVSLQSSVSPTTPTRSLQEETLESYLCCVSET
ncbi:uncharacterized protein LOC143025689 [Oratosquilla oratoria]|uniref:uncharacterized protein LOC143025689 n=1 Tax=Oratosquilla oratoria TaxID=337810 RepID=UPI003F764372